MRDRVFKNWTFTRVVFLAIGLWIITQSVLSDEWVGVAFGGYFASMGIFAFGCAAGNCASGQCLRDPEQTRE